jgi:divalent metal cation (Fe/Co/Zn/Cd) transporter
MFETIIAVIGGAFVSAAVFGLRKAGAMLFAKKYGSIIEKTFSVIDPVAGQLIGNYDGSTVQEAIKLAVARVADSDISDDDVAAIATFVIQKFDPSLAAVKALDPETEEGKATEELIANVKALRSGASFEKVYSIVKGAAALI